MSLLLPASCFRGFRMFPTTLRSFSNSIPSSKWKIVEKEEDGVTVVSMEEIPSETRKETDLCSLCTCNIPVKLKYSDVLILEQFMREDGTVLPKQLTGLCSKQQLRLERCVMQAHWAGLFPDKTIPEFDRAGYKRFNRYWNDDMDMYKLKEKKEPGTWYYIKRYPTKNNAVNRKQHVMFSFWFFILLTEAYAQLVQEPLTPPGISANGSDIVWAKYGSQANISCDAFGTPAPVVEWWLYRPATYLGRYDSETGRVYYENVSELVRQRFSIHEQTLLLHNVNRTTVERYVCIVSNTHGNSTKIFKFRLDYSGWYSRNLFDSVFWGALAFCIVVCALTFLLNITWILTRKSILWWIQRAERLSRVRKMVEAMEKYRVRQLENLQDKYTRRVQLIRDNYHQQVEQMRVSYALQSEKFRDYRAAQMETVTSHLENMRENYQQQLNRMREYGSRRAEQLWESYERQVNRMKAFSLQHRMNLMRQYKIKQRHLNKLLESFHDPHSPEALRKHEEEVRAALELPEAPVIDDETGNPISRSSSFYSLPEYVLDESGVLRPSPLVPTVRFVRDLKSPSSNDQVGRTNNPNNTD